MRFLSRALLIALLPLMVFAQQASIVETHSGEITADETWGPDRDHLLDGIVYVTNNATLTILPGTHIYGRRTSGSPATTSALIITRGAQINANGTASQPIIFTAEGDDLSDPYDLTKRDRALWGGVILLGYAQTNRAQPIGSSDGPIAQFYHIEGLFYDYDNQDSRLHYGWGDVLAAPINDDNSGTLRYVSIRHGGFTLGDANEINGLTMGAVGSGTTIEYVEVYANDDDGFEWFGGTVNCKYLISAYVDDDDFDLDEGYAGQVQFAFSVKDTLVGGGRTFEWDGGVGETGGDGRVWSLQNDAPFADATFSNVTAIGPGNDARGASAGGDGDQFFIFRDNTYGDVYNMIAVADDDPVLANLDSDGATNQCDFATVYYFDTNPSIDEEATNVFKVLSTSAAASNPLGNYDPDAGVLDPVPTATFASNFTYPELSDPFFTSVAYAGAFEPGVEPWYNGWSAISQKYDDDENFSASLISGWDLVGLPLDGPDSLVASLYPSNTGAFDWNGSTYSTKTVAKDVQTGFWLDLPTGDASYNYNGATVITADIEVPGEGWLIVSGISVPVAVADIVDPDNIFNGSIFGWNGSVYDGSVSVIEPNKGYWMNFDGPGFIRLNVPAGATLPKVAPAEKYVAGTPVYFEDAMGNEVKLYLNASVENIKSYQMPPLPPAGFDVRFIDDYFINEAATGMVTVMADAYPVRISADETMTIKVNDETHVIEAGQSFELTSGVSAVQISSGGSESVSLIPSEFDVYQNYPNPFNPDTQIRFSLPEASDVEVTIYNAIGQKVRTLLSKTMDAGYQTVNWNATDDNGVSVNSGVYYYTVKAGNKQATHKMMLIK